MKYFYTIIETNEYIIQVFDLNKKSLMFWMTHDKHITQKKLEGLIKGEIKDKKAYTLECLYDGRHIKD